METRSISFKRDDDVLLSIHSYARSENISGFILGIVGNLSKAVFQCPGNSQPTSLEGNLEVITLNGTISPNKLHLHLSVSDGNCNVWGGHLEAGSLVLKGIDVLIGITKPNQIIKNNKSTNKTSRIVIMVIPNCAWCARIIRILESRNIQHDIINIIDESLFNMAKEKSNSSLFPQVYIDDKYIGGYDQFTQLLESSSEIIFQ